MTTINTDQDYQNRVQHFAALKSKYQAEKHQDSSPSSPLYLILRKADLGIELNDIEFIWLQKENLSTTVTAIRQEQLHRHKEKINLGVEFTRLKTKYKVTSYNISWSASPLYFILTKIEAGKLLNESEDRWLISHDLYPCKKTALDTQKFINLKSKHKANKYQDSHPDSPLYPILKKIDIEERLSGEEYKWLVEKQLLETLEIVKEQESKRRVIFTELKEKYQAIKYKNKSLLSPLYSILQKVEAEEKLIDSEIAWLEEQGLSETIAIVQELEQTREFVNLKSKYKAIEHEDNSPKSHLYKVLKNIESGNCLAEQDINFLKKRNLTETIKIANDKYANFLKTKIASSEFLDDSEMVWMQTNGYEEIIILAQQRQFAILKKKYGLIDPNLQLEPFYSIMLKLERNERLDPLLVVQLIEQGMLSRDGKIAIAHYRLEAEFYEQELKQTGNKHKIPTASSYWRKANEPEQALRVTNVDLGKIKDGQLKSAILVTRGAAFRDMSKLANAESCAEQAMNCQPNAYQPYTLMGAICYDKYEYAEGEMWFEEAIKRGAKSEDIDDEIRRVIASNKNEEKRNEAAEYLLKKDSHRYAWAKAYLKKPKDKK